MYGTSEVRAREEYEQEMRLAEGSLLEDIYV